MADNNKVSSIAAGITGAAIGAGVALLATKLMSDKDIREKIMETAGKARDTFAHTVSMAKKRGKMAGKEAMKNVPAAFSHQIRMGRKSKKEAGSQRKGRISRTK